ncbi:hypothetical protein D3C72_1880730 [compost metagenome]
MALADGPGNVCRKVIILVSGVVEQNLFVGSLQLNDIPIPRDHVGQQQVEVVSGGNGPNFVTHHIGISERPTVLLTPFLIGLLPCLTASQIGAQFGHR